MTTNTQAQCGVCLADFPDYKVNGFFCCSVKYCKDCYDQIKSSGKCAGCRQYFNTAPKPRLSVRATDMYHVTVKMTSPNSNRLISIESPLFRSNQWEYQLRGQNGRVTKIEFTCTLVHRTSTVHKIVVTPQQLKDKLYQTYDRMGLAPEDVQGDENGRFPQHGRKVDEIINNTVAAFLADKTGTEDWCEVIQDYECRKYFEMLGWL